MDSAKNQSNNSAIAGGIAGRLSSGSISDCYTNTDVESAVLSMDLQLYITNYTPTLNAYAGGIVGQSTKNIARCFSMGSQGVYSHALCQTYPIEANTAKRNLYQGDLIGNNSSGTMTNCFYKSGNNAVGNGSASGTTAVSSFTNTTLSTLVNYNSGSVWNNTSPPTLRQFVRATGISLNKTATTIILGNSETLIATISPSAVSNPSVTWSSSNPSVATVNSSGVVNAVSNGTATVTAKTEFGTLSASCAVTVVAPTITLNQNGATTNGATSQSVVYGGVPAQITPLPGRTGYAFYGYWTAVSGGTRVFDASGNAIANVNGYTNASRQWVNTSTSLTLYAQWTAINCTIMLNQNGATTNGANSCMVAYNGVPVQIALLPVRTGYTFNGYWTAASGGTQVFDASGNVIANISGYTNASRQWVNTSTSLTLYAQWTTIAYTISFVDWDGSLLKEETVPSGSAATAPANPTRTGFEFTRWNPADFSNVTGDMTITAVYKAIDDPNAPVIAVGNAEGVAGSTVTIPVKIVNNPGLSDVNLMLEYDADLTLLNFKTDSTTMTLDDVSNIEYKTAMLTNPTTSGFTGETLLYLEFKVSPEATPGAKSITITSAGASDKNANYVSVGLIAGFINVPDFLYGDVNGDGSVLTNDLTVLRRYFANWPDIAIHQGADVNGDGQVLTNDLTILRRYFANWPGIVLGPPHTAPVVAASELIAPANAVLSDEPIINNPIISVATVEAEKGETVDVAVTIEGNPGLADARLDFQFGSDLTLIDFITDSTTMPLDPVSDVLYSTASLSDPTINGYTGTTLVILRFKISDTAEDGMKNITLSIPTGVSDKDASIIYPSIINGGVMISNNTPPAITTTFLPDGMTGAPYRQALEATGNGITWSLTDDSLPLPDGLALDPYTGEITGTPAATGTFEFTVKAANSVDSATQTLSITVSDLPLVQLSFAGVTDGVKTVTYGDPTFTESAAVTLPAPASYNGEISYSSGDTTIATVDSATGQVTIVKAGQTTITANASGVAGSYAPGTASYDLTVSKKSISITGATISGKVYDGDTAILPASVTAVTFSGAVSETPLTLGETFTVTDAAFIDNANVGAGKPVKITVALTGKEAYANYSLSNSPYQGAGATANITAKPITITPAPGQSRTYEADDPTFTFTSTPALIGGDSFTGKLGYEGSDSGTAPDVGTYPFTIGTLSAGDNYKLTLGGNVDFEITKESFVTFEHNIPLRYDDTSTQTLDIAAIFDSKPGIKSYELASVIDEDGIIGNAAVSPEGMLRFNLANGVSYSIAKMASINIAVGGFTNYNDTVVNVMVSLYDKDSTDLINPIWPSDITYGETLSAPSATPEDTGSGVAFTYTYTGELSDENGTIYNSDTAPTEPGSYTVTIGYEDDTYKASITSPWFTIDKKDLSWDSAGSVNNKVYDGTQAATAALQPTLSGIINSDAVTTANGTVTFTDANAGDSVAVTAAGYGVGGADAWKYNAPTEQPAFAAAAISKANASGVDRTFYVIENLDGSYNFDMAALLPDVASPMTLGAVTYDPAITANDDGLLGALSYTTGGILTIPVLPAVGSATITVDIASDNFDISIATITIETTEKTALTISGVTVSSRAYNGQAIEMNGEAVFTDTATGYIVPLTAEYAWSGANAPNAPVDAGSYTLTVSADGGDYYLVNDLTISFDITQATITVTADNKAAKANDAQPAYTWTETGRIAGDNWLVVPIASATPNMSSAGNYPITVSGGDAGGNYSISYISGVMTVEPLSGACDVIAVAAPVGAAISGNAITASAPNATSSVTVNVTTSAGSSWALYSDQARQTEITNKVMPLIEGANTAYIMVTAENGATKVYTLTITRAAAGGGPGGGGPGGGGLSPITVEPVTVIEDVQTALSSGDFLNTVLPFEDVAENAWYSDAVKYVYSNNLMAGTSTDPMLFSPSLQTTRGMIVTILYRYAGSPDVSGLANPFNDLKVGSWYYDAVIWAAVNGIVSGYGDGKFGPDDNITREQLAAILSNYADKAELSLSSLRDYTGFSDDAAIGGYAKQAVEHLYMAGIIDGKPDGSFDPKGSATRAEVATMLMRFIEAAVKANA